MNIPSQNITTKVYGHTLKLIMHLSFAKHESVDFVTNKKTININVSMSVCKRIKFINLMKSVQSY